MRDMELERGSYSGMKDAPRERDERWAPIVLAVLAVAYVVYRYRGDLGLDLPDLSFEDLKEFGTALPYLGATLFSVLFQVWNRRRQRAARAEMERQLMREGPMRQVDGMTVRHGRGRRQSFEADLHLTRSALYVFDSGKKRDPMRIAAQSDLEGPYIEDAELLPSASGGPHAVRIMIGGPKPQVFQFTSPDAVGWWIDVRRTIGKSTDVEAELAGHSGTGGAGEETGRPGPGAGSIRRGMPAWPAQPGEASPQNGGFPPGSEDEESDDDDWKGIPLIQP
ncbi:MAG: hypothetical protein GF400_09800 [Candidatus Eisenbacteria bacterium]|nr:hypothetical protein [Candidatus Eisenbacteria bacterium]